MHKWWETDAPIWQKVICSRRCISLAWHHRHMSHVVTRGSRHQEVSHSCDHQLISDHHVTCDNVVTDTRISMSPEETRCNDARLWQHDRGWHVTHVTVLITMSGPGGSIIGCLVFACHCWCHISHTTPDILIPGSRIRWMAAAQWLWWIFCGSEIPISHPT